MKLTVIAVVCDQGVSHRNCMTTLGVTPEQPYFTVGSSHKVYVMYDMPHLVKNIRNNLLRYDFVLDGSETVSFDHILELFRLDGSTLRLAPKLTKQHVDPQVFKRMNVRLAAQVLSHSLGTAIHSFSFRT